MTSTFCPPEKANMETASGESYIVEESQLNILDHSHIFENRALYVIRFWTIRSGAPGDHFQSCPALNALCRSITTIRLRWWRVKEAKAKASPKMSAKLGQRSRWLRGPWEWGKRVCPPPRTFPPSCGAVGDSDKN